MSAFPLLMLVVIGGAFWFLVLRPARQRQQQQSSLLQSLTVGQHVMTTSGLFGEVTAIAGDRVSIEVSDGVVVDFLNLAIAKVIDEPAAATEEAGDADETVVITDGATAPSTTAQ